MDIQKKNKMVIDVELQRKEFDLLKKEVEELNSALERARNIINDLAHKSVDIVVKLEAITCETQHEPDSHSEDIGIHLSELPTFLHTQDK